MCFDTIQMDSLTVYSLYEPLLDFGVFKELKGKISFRKDYDYKALRKG